MKKQNILIVDDESSNITVLAEILNEEYNVLAATDGAIALDIVSSGETVDLILLDIVMPNMDGYEVCRTLKNDILHNDIPIMFLTTKDSVDDMVKGFEYGGVDYIIKPFNKKELLIRVKTHLQNYLLLERIKEHVDMLQESKELKLMTLQQSKMASLGGMLASISHQWKQPLSIISATAMRSKMNELLKDTPDETVLNSLEEIEKQIDFMVSTMHNFKNFFKPDKEKSKFLLMRSSYELIDLFSKKFIENSIVIHLESKDKKDIEVFGYESMYKQALLNLILNAADEIIEKKSENTGIFIECDKNSEYGIVTITDYAGQIPQENIDKVFTQYFTTKGDKGSGIGLSMTKQIVEELNSGKLCVKNVEDGVVFSIKLPLQKN